MTPRTRGLLLCAVFFASWAGSQCAPFGELVTPSRSLKQADLEEASGEPDRKAKREEKSFRSSFKGCPAPSQAANATCPLPKERRCNPGDTSPEGENQCGKNRICCPEVHPALSSNCGSCKRKRKCECSNKKEPVCGSDEETYRNICWLECAGVEWDCAGKCPCSRNKVGKCPLPNGARIETKCPKGIRCRADEDCDLLDICCPDYSAVHESNCGHFCQSPVEIENEECKSRVKPIWLGSIQGLVSLARFWFLTRVDKSRHKIIAISLNAGIELAEMGAMAVDFFVLDSAYLNTFIGDNSLLELLEIIFALCIIVKNTSADTSNGGNQGDGQKQDQKQAVDEEKRNKRTQLVGFGASIIYAARLLVVIIAAGTFVLGAIPYVYLAVLGIVCILVFAALNFCFWKPKWGVNGALDFTAPKLFQVWIPGLLLGTALLVAFTFTEFICIAGWQHLLRQPEFLYAGESISECGNGASIFEQGCYDRVTIVERNDFREFFDTVLECASLSNWIRDWKDVIVMIVGIL